MSDLRISKTGMCIIAHQGKKMKSHCGKVIREGYVELPSLDDQTDPLCAHCYAVILAKRCASQQRIIERLRSPWVSVGERLPEVGIDVFTRGTICDWNPETDTISEVVLYQMDRLESYIPAEEASQPDDDWSNEPAVRWELSNVDEVTHWMPIPDLPDTPPPAPSEVEK